MTTEQILELARAARRSPHARRVLHDAFIETFGDAYLQILVDAQFYADRWRTPQIVFFAPDRLREMMERWGRKGRVPRYIFSNWNVFRIQPARTLHLARNRAAQVEQQVVTVRPRSPSVSRAARVPLV